MKIKNINWNNFFNKNIFNFGKKLILATWHILFNENFEEKKWILENKILILKILIKMFIIYWILPLHALDNICFGMTVYLLFLNILQQKAAKMYHES